MATRFAVDEADAELRFTRYHAIDPFPEIAPALLNSADITDYVAATGMVFPFVEDEDHLKTASYEVPLLGRYVYWDDHGEQNSDIISPGDPFILKANAIAFVTLEPTFRIPDYIALRFNLRITNIYRGILLGTGPLVDPGFIGRLSLPLHNLTINDYPLTGGDGLIWMEFTKVSHHTSQDRPRRGSRGPRREGRLFSIQPYKANPSHDVRYYLNKAWPAGPIRSSIPDATRMATKSAQDAATSASSSAEDVQGIRRLFARIGFLGTIVAVVTVGSLLVMTYQLVDGTSGRIDGLTREMAALQAAAQPSSTPTPTPRTTAQADIASQQRLVTGVSRVSKRAKSDRRWFTIWLLAITAVLLVWAVIAATSGRDQAPSVPPSNSSPT